MGGIWWRSGRNSAALFLYGRRRYHVPTPINLLYRSRLIKQDTHIILPLLHPHSDCQSFFARSYAGLAKVKAKEGGNKIQAVTEHDGPRLNAEITAYEVRLVSENGHEVISRREALARAKKLKLDLVEVQRNANPPVCKIMDHNKEKYKQQQREKERTKNKPELILRKADCREIRYTSKTEQKDLERKAEMVKRLLERGYRVKCTAMGTAQENLEEQLLRLSTLIEDFSIVESGPSVEKKGAWLIVKHVKFGHAKRKEVQQTPKSEEIIKQGHSSLPMSANLNIGPEKQVQIGQYDCKQFVPVDGLKQVIFGKIQSDQRLHASNVGKLGSVDSVSECASASIMANVKDIPDDHQFQVSTTSEVTNNIVEELQTPPIKLIYAASTQDQQKIAIGTPKIPAASLSQALVNRSSGSHEKTGKRPLADILPKEANESRWAILKQVKPSCFDGNNNSTPANEVMRNIVEDLQSSPANLNNGAGAQDSQKMSIGSAQISADGSRQVLVKHSSGDKEKGVSETVKKPLKDVLSEQANECRWASLGHHKPSCFGDNNNTTATSEITSFVFEELQNSPVKLNNDAPTKDQQHMAIGSPQIASHGLEQVLVNCSSSNREICASEAGKQPLADMVPKQPNESQWETFREIKTSNVKGNNNTATQVQLGVSNGKHDVVSDDTRQDPPCPRPSHQGHHVSNIEKQIPITLASIPDKVLGEIHGIFPQGPSTVDVNEYGLTKTKIGVKNAKQTTPSEHKRQDISAVRSGPSGYSATKEVEHKPLDCSPKQANNTRLSTSGISEELPMSSVQVTKIAMPRKSLEISNSNTIPWYDARKAPAVDSPSGQGSCVSVTGKQSPIDSYSRQSSASGGSHWGIFSQPKNSVVENQRHPTKMSHDQSKKEQPNILWGSNIGASDEAQNDADPRHLHIQNQRKVPISSTVTSKQDPKHTENEAVNEPRQKGWGIFSKKVLAKPLDTKGKPEV